MGQEIVECVPNISEGRDRRIIEHLVDAVQAVDGVQVLHVDCGWDANRSVLTFVGSPQSVLNGAKVLVREALVSVDMSRHTGAHPRIGAVDVCPFVPLSNVSYETCIGLARSLGSYCGEHLDLPVFLYARASADKRTKRLWQLRRNGIRGLSNRIAEGELVPAFGPGRLNPKFGALVTGARGMMIALNVSLARGGIDAAKHIARMVRANPKERKGQNVPSHLLEHTGLHNVQAIGWEMSKLGVYQVSMNLLEPDKSGIYEVYCAVAQWAKYLGCGVAGAEMIGLALEKYFIEAGRLFAKDLGLELQAGKELIELAYHELRFGHLMSEITSDRTIEGLLSIGEIQWSWK